MKELPLQPAPAPQIDAKVFPPNENHNNKVVQKFWNINRRTWRMAMLCKTPGHVASWDSLTMTAHTQTWYSALSTQIYQDPLQCLSTKDQQYNVLKTKLSTSHAAARTQGHNISDDHINHCEPLTRTTQARQKVFHRHILFPSHDMFHDTKLEMG